MSFKKGDKKGKKSPSFTNSKTALFANLSTNTTSTTSTTGTGAGASMPEGARGKLLELFSQIEYQFEQVHVENTARKLVQSMLYNLALTNLIGDEHLHEAR